MYTCIKKLFSNPIINFVLATLVAFAFFFFSKNYTEISYSVSKEEIIVSKQKGTPELTFHWKEEPVTQDLKRLKIAIWNSGNTYIDYNAISNTIKFQIKLSGVNSIMSQKISSYSRENLDVTSSFNTVNKDIININFNGDDALEVSDGFVISIFYVGEESPNVELLGRVKGMHDKFSLVQWSSIKSSIGESGKTLWSVLGFIFICGITLTIPFWDLTVKNNLAEAYKVISLFLGVITCTIPILLLFGLINVMYFGLPWVL